MELVSLYRDQQKLRGILKGAVPSGGGHGAPKGLGCPAVTDDR